MAPGVNNDVKLCVHGLTSFHRIETCIQVDTTHTFNQTPSQPIVSIIRAVVVSNWGCQSLGHVQS